MLSQFSGLTASAPGGLGGAGGGAGGVGGGGDGGGGEAAQHVWQGPVQRKQQPELVCAVATG